jgi:(1->4)-alpha-D-glucan 1-alpha-D-glucosylmutase
VSGPAAAKGVEDAAFYVHVPLLSRNEVGADPGVSLAEAVGAFHRRNAERARDWPATMLALTTHDTKRSSDARSRIDVLSEVASDWTEAVARWRRWNAPHHGAVDESAAPDPNTEYVFYQSLVAIWPIGDGTSRYAAPSRDAVGALAERMHAYMEKAAREAGRMTSWTEPNACFERALHAFIDVSLTGAACARFVRDVAAFVARVARPGLWNSLAKLVLQLGSPGVADVYQGDELWSFTLVDPDNRRPVDFRLRRALLGEISRRFDDAPSAAARRAWLARLVAHAEDGRIKLHVLHQGLRLRQRFPELFSGGGYAPLLPAAVPSGMS